jgi:hypothetical protein
MISETSEIASEVSGIAKNPEKQGFFIFPPRAACPCRAAAWIGRSGGRAGGRIMAGMGVAKCFSVGCVANVVTLKPIRQTE